ncbi:hypothetical protein [uncultured Mediterranean phage uvMED]|nr:hypothetical protein [uncultured Mediterranean phage uvMED]
MEQRRAKVERLRREDAQKNNELLCIKFEDFKKFKDKGE